MAKGKRRSRDKRNQRAADEDDEWEKNTKNKKHQAQEEGNEEREQENPLPTTDYDTHMNDLADSDFEKSEDESPTSRLRRHNRPKLSDWTKEIIRDFVRKYGDRITKELQSEKPDFSKIESYFDKLNAKISSENGRHRVPLDRNLVQKDMYRMTYNALFNHLELDNVKDNPHEQWKAFYETRRMFRALNRESYLPVEWNLPPSVAERLFGERPSGIEEPPDDDDADSAVSFSDESESEKSDSDDEAGGIDALEARMRKEYSSLSRGKVLYWWPVGTGTQTFVRYGSKKAPVYRVRAGSSIPYDPRAVEQVLSNTPGNSKLLLTADGNKQEVWKFKRDDVEDIIGVGWKVEGDDDAGANALTLIRPTKETYPHTRVLVKWKNGDISLERRGFVRRIAHGNRLNGDRMIYLKAKELERNYWGYDLEEESDKESDDSDISSSDESSYRRTHSRRSGRHHARTRSTRKAIRSTESDETGDSDVDSETSDSSHEQVKRRSRRHVRSKKPRSKDESDTDTDIRYLMDEIKRLKLKKRRKESDRSRKTRRHRT